MNCRGKSLVFFILFFRYGNCKVCGKLVYMSQQRVVSHKRGNFCIGISAAEKQFFRALGNEEVATNLCSPESQQLSSLQPAQGAPKAKVRLSYFFDKVSPQEKEKLDELVANFLFRCSLSFRVVDSVAFKELMSQMRPSYKPPSSRLVATKLLKNTYDAKMRELRNALENAAFYSISLDGWTNVSHHYLVNFMIKIQGKPAYYLKSVDGSKSRHDARFYFGIVQETLLELGVEKCVSVLTDNENVMQSLADLIEAKYPHILCTGCSAHGLNLFIKNLVKIDSVKDIFQKSMFLARFVNDKNRLRITYEEEIRSIFKITSSMSFLCDTRFYTFYTHGKSVLDNRSGLRCLVEEHETLLNSFDSTLTAEFKEIVNDRIFWKNLKFIIDDVLFPARKAIGLFEAEEASVEIVYETYHRLYNFYGQLPDGDIIDSRQVQNLLLADWNYMHSESMGFAYILAPKNLGLPMNGSDYVDTVEQVSTFKYSNKSKKSLKLKIKFPAQPPPAGFLQRKFGCRQNCNYPIHPIFVRVSFVIGS